MKLFTRININPNNKEIDMRIFFTKYANSDDVLPPFTKNYHFSYIKRDYN